MQSELWAATPSPTPPSAAPISSRIVDVLDISEAGAAVLLRNQHPEQPELAELGEQLARELLPLVPVTGVGGDLVAGEVPHHVSDGHLVLAELEVHGHLLGVAPVDIVGGS